MSDIHGNMRRFRSVMEQIQLQPEDTLYVLGDVIDRFPDGIEIDFTEVELGTRFKLEYGIIAKGRAIFISAELIDDENGCLGVDGEL